MNRSGIPYLTHTWSPTTGCSPVSVGCENCWAASYHRRWRKPFAPTFHPEKLDEPLRLRKPAVIGVSFMGDLFNDGIPDEFIAAALGVMAAADRHTFIVLTKRPERMRSVLSNDHEYTKLAEEFCVAHEEGDPLFRALNRGWFQPMPLPNVYLGVSVEDQATANERIPILLDTPAAHRWVSLEPQVGPVSFSVEWMMGLDWIVQGCESGPRRRQFDVQWARTVRAECAAAPVPYYLKQIQGHCEDPRHAMLRCQREHVIEKPTLDGRQHLDLPWEVKP